MGDNLAELFQVGEDVWCRTDAALSRFRPRTRTFTNFPWADLGATELRVFVVDGERVWLGTDRGPQSFELTSDTLVPFPQQALLESASIRGVELLSGNLFITTDAEVVQIHKTNRSVRRFTEADGLTRRTGAIGTLLSGGAEAKRERSPDLRPRPRLDWPGLLRRTFGFDVFDCPCGGKRRVLALFTSPAAAREILGLPTRAAPRPGRPANRPGRHSSRSSDPRRTGRPSWQQRRRRPQCGAPDGRRPRHSRTVWHPRRPTSATPSARSSPSPLEKPALKPLSVPAVSG